MKHFIQAWCYDKKGNLLSTAINSYTKSHPLQAHFANLVGMPQRIYLHAEIAAILKCGDKKIFSIKIERRNRKGKLLPSKPCPICSKAIEAFEISKIEFQDYDPVVIARRAGDGIW